MATLYASPVMLDQATRPFRLAGAWALTSNDRRVSGISGLTADRDRLVAVTDLGSAFIFAAPTSGDRHAFITDLREGPGRFGYKVSRDAEAIATDGKGGWLVALEQRHSVWRYDGRFVRGRRVAAIDRDWLDNGGAEAILLSRGRPVVLSQDGTEVLALDSVGWRGSSLDTRGWDVADAATAPGGEVWLLLRRFGFRGFDNAVARLTRTADGYSIGRAIAVPKGRWDNLEGLAITPGPDGLRFWLVSDDGHRIFARSLLVALDLPQTQESARR